MMQGALASLAAETELEIGQPEVEGCVLGASALLLLDGYSILFGHSTAQQTGDEETIEYAR